MDLQHELHVARSLARRAAAEILRLFRQPIDAEEKDERDVVTLADRRAEQLLRAGLLAAFPDDQVLGEEDGVSGSTSGQRLWAVDPLDGTVNFVHGHPFFCVSVGLLDPQGSPLLGILEAPALGESYEAVLGQGARRNGLPLRVSSTRDLRHALVATGFPAPARKNPAPFVPPLAAVLASTQGIRRCGSAALDLAGVASGVYDAYYEMALNPWDVAAGILLVREAGGLVTDFRGRPADTSGRAVLASNPHLHPRILPLLQSLDVEAGQAAKLL